MKWRQSLGTRFIKFIICECKVMHMPKICHLWKRHFPGHDVNTSDDVSIGVLHAHHVVENTRLLVQTTKDSPSKISPEISLIKENQESSFYCLIGFNCFSTSLWRYTCTCSQIWTEYGHIFEGSFHDSMCCL